MQSETIITQALPYRDKIYRYALKIVSNPMDAEDVVQEVMIKLWQKKESIDQIENVEAWCMTVARNLSIDKIRRRKNSSTEIESYHFISDTAATPDVVAEDKESLSYVMKIMGELPEHQREIVHLRDVEGYTYREIAEIAGLSEDQVKVNLFRARQKLKVMLKDFEY